MRFAEGVAVTSDITLVRPLREGAMGRVWVAMHAKLGCEVAVKFMADKLARDRTMLSRFNREAESAAQIRSPHVVTILEHGTTDSGTPFIAMELLSGETLGQLLERDARLSMPRTAGILRQVGSALDAAHARGIVHRDIKPDNLFLARNGTRSITVKVLDFGMAKRVRESDENLTATGVAVGTPEFMSPEQVLGAKDIDFRSDLWGLAVVAYKMLTGAAAFEAATPHALFFTICKGSFVPLARHGSPTEFEPWFLRAFQPSKEKRFGSAREMVLRFEACVSAARVADMADEESTNLRELPTTGAPTLESFAVPPAPDSQTNPRYLRQPEDEDPLESTLELARTGADEEDSAGEDVPTQMVTGGDTAHAIRKAIADLGDPMGASPESQTTLRLQGLAAPGSDPGSDSAKTTSDEAAREALAALRETMRQDPDNAEDPDSESVPGFAKPSVPLSSDAPLDYPDMGDADTSGPRRSFASHSPDSSGARVSVSTRSAEAITKEVSNAPPRSANVPHSAPPAGKRRKANSVVTIGVLAAVGAVVIFAITQRGTDAAPQDSPVDVASAAIERTPAPTPQQPAASGDALASDTQQSASATSVAASEAVGTLSITCQPQCTNVRMGDKMLGPTPLLKKTLPAGKHRLTLVRLGMSPSIVEVEILADRHVTRSFNLSAPAPTPAAEPKVVDDPYEDEVLPVAPGEVAPPPAPPAGP